jgi:hypothetical protein
MIDLMVSLVIVAVLVALMLPAISMVRESTHRVICASNLRQIGLGVSLYSQDRRDQLPDSIFLPDAPQSNALAQPSYERMDTVWVSLDEFPELGNKRWDGLGWLFGEDYLTASSIFYCPSHEGNYRLEDCQDKWMNLPIDDEIVANYLFRGSGPDGSRILYNIDARAALITDTLRSYEDLNHESGFNVLQAGLAVDWYDDIGDSIANDLLARSGDDPSNTVQDAWGRLDEIPGEAE